MKWWNSQKSQKIVPILSILLVITIIFDILAFVAFDRKLYNKTLNESIPQVEELSKYVELSIHGELKRCLQILQSSAALIDDKQDMFSADTMTRLKQVQTVSGYQCIGIMDFSGKQMNTNDDLQHIFRPRFFTCIQNGEIYISNAHDDGNGNHIMFAVPLMVNNRIEGALWGTYALADIVNTIEISESARRYFQIIDDQGSYISASKSIHALKHEGSIWEELDKYDYPGGSSPEEIYETVQRGESGSFYFSVDGEGRYVHYRPLGVNN